MRIYTTIFFIRTSEKYRKNQSQIQKRLKDYELIVDSEEQEIGKIIDYEQRKNIIQEKRKDIHNQIK